MNVVFLSPHFPANYYPFAVHLRDLGVNVLGLADCPYDHLRYDLRRSLTEYYRVTDMHHYDELLRACGFFTYHYGKIDRIVSHNEYWLETEAKLRTDFNIFGIKAGRINRTKKKSEMKKIFRSAGVAHARGEIIHTYDAAAAFIEKVGYPVVAKPDIGVGAAYTYKIRNEEELARLFREKPEVEYIMEEFVKGDIYSFDGLVNRDGRIVFSASHRFNQGIMETVNEDKNLFYYSLREIPGDIRAAGENLVKEFGLQETFFHFEFFRLADGSLVALEVNIRPPGGLTTDMFNYACDIDVYRGWASVVAYNSFYENWERKYHVVYVGRKHNRNYRYSHAEILWNLGSYLRHEQPISPIFSAVLGNHGYIARAGSLAEIEKIVAYIHQES